MFNGIMAEYHQTGEARRKDAAELDPNCGALDFGNNVFDLAEWTADIASFPMSLLPVPVVPAICYWGPLGLPKERRCAQGQMRDYQCMAQTTPPSMLFGN